MTALTRRSLLGWGAAAASGLVLAGCGEEERRAAAPAADGGPTADALAALDGMTLTTCVYARNHASSPLFWQRFAPEGVTVDVKIITSSAEVQTGLENGDLDFGLMGVYNTIIAGDQQGISSKIVGMVAREGIGLIGTADAGIDGVADLAGKRIAVPPPGVQVLILNELLAREGLVLGEDCEAIPLGYADHPGALERGDVDAYVGTEPLCTQSVLSGVGTRLSEVYDTALGDFNTGLWASPAMLEQPDVVRACMQLNKAAAEHLTPGGENDEAVWTKLLVDQFGYAEDVSLQVLENVGAEWEFTSERQSQFEGAGEVLLGQGVISAEPDYEAFYARQYWEV
jgi:NitT/TauT family transport system substrate-binding protein